MTLGPVLRSVLGSVLRPALSEGGGAAAYASHPAPDGYRWDFVTQDGVRVTYLNEPVVALVRIN